MAFVAQFVLAALLGLVGMVIGDVCGLVGAPLLALVIGPPLAIGCGVGWLGAREHRGVRRSSIENNHSLEPSGRPEWARSARWTWALAAGVFIGLWSASGFFDGFYNDFIGGYCGDFRCVPGLLVTGPALACVAYSAGAFIGWRWSSLAGAG